ncbi:centromere protein U isoform X2 [Tenrec ecaudatus]|uniref:centromere protein U isoform X2 n=1 Tax=Tenrec ecaudatus TaxID=94439 RepID=UPI003F5AC829
MKHSKKALGRAHLTKDRATKPPDVSPFPDRSNAFCLGRLDENEQDEEPYEAFVPPLHSTAIYGDEEELHRLTGSSTSSTRPGKDTGRRSSRASANKASQSNSSKHETNELEGSLQLALDESKSSDGTRQDQPAKKRSSQQHEAIPATAPSERSPKPKKTQKKRQRLNDQRKKSRSKNVDSDGDNSDGAFIWCLEGKKTRNIQELDVVLSAFEKTFSEYEQRIKSSVCKEAIHRFYSTVKDDLIKMINEVQKLRTLKRTNVKMISAIEKKRQRLIEAQNELLRLEPQLEQLQTKYKELKERKSSLMSAASFLSDLQQLHQGYSAVPEKEPDTTPTYDASSLPALLMKARGLLGAETHLRNINHQLEKLLGQE